MSEWEWLTIASRWLLYISMSATIGGAASQGLTRHLPQLQPALKRYTLIAALAGLFSVGVHFLIRVGSLAEQGIEGLFDPLMLQILWASSVGDALVLRTAGFILLLAALLLAIPARRSGLKLVGEVILLLSGGALVAFSYSQTGHVAGGDALSAVLLSIHIILTAWWMGSLFPLWLVSHSLSSEDAHQVMRRFGQLAVGAVLILLGAGVLLSYQLTGWNNLIGSEYGFWLMIKVGLVMLILALAAYHKLVLVPALAQGGSGQRLKRSIMLEKCVGAAILSITTVLTTLVGPVH